MIITSSIDPIPEFWVVGRLIALGLRYIGDWDRTYFYRINDIVFYFGLWIAF
jgi:hypothetical protein